MTLTEEKLNSSIRGGRIERVYYLYGKEPFLVKTYTDKIIKKTVGDDPFDMNFIRLSGNPKVGDFIDYIEGLPVFSDVKTVVVNDVEPDKMEPKELEAYIGLMGNIPDTTVVIFNITGFQPEEKKAATKKFIAAIEKNGIVCKLDSMPQAKMAGLVVKKAGKSGIVISGEDAMYLTERVLCNMTLLSEETTKLINYVGTGGTITREIIDILVGKLLDTSAYELATAINAGKREDAFRILDEVITERTEPVNILSALSSTFLDFYKAKLAKIKGVLPSQAVIDMGYAKNREWAFNRAMNSVSKLRLDYLRKTVFILNEADNKIKSIPVDPCIILEQTVTRLFEARTGMYV